jgi:hypothetical protein
MTIDWTWLIIGLLVGMFFGGTIRGAVSGLKSKTVG